MENKILLTGGSGLLGNELIKYLPKALAPSSSEMNILDLNTYIPGDFDLVIHCAGFTDVTMAEQQKAKCFDLNVRATKNLVNYYSSAKFVYISSEYVKNPVNFYSLTKLWGEEMVRHFSERNLIIRTLFKANPFPYNEAFTDQFTEGDYVDVIAPMIVKEIFKNSYRTIDIGTGRKTIFELARKTRPDIKGISVDDIKDVKLPKDYQ